MQPRKVHPAQRYEVTSVGPYEYVGAIEEYDVIWLPDAGRVLMKSSYIVGDSYRIDITNPSNTGPGYGFRGNTPKVEQIDLAVHMAKIFGSPIPVLDGMEDDDGC